MLAGTRHRSPHTGKNVLRGDGVYLMMRGCWWYRCVVKAMMLSEPCSWAKGMGAGIPPELHTAVARLAINNTCASHT